MLKIYFHISLSSALKATFLLPPADIDSSCFHPERNQRSMKSAKFSTHARALEFSPIILAWIFRDRCEFATYFVEASLTVLEGYKSFFLTEKLCFFYSHHYYLISIIFSSSHPQPVADEIPFLPSISKWQQFIAQDKKAVMFRNFIDAEYKCCCMPNTDHWYLLFLAKKKMSLCVHYPHLTCASSPQIHIILPSLLL